MEKISIILLNYNGFNDTKECINSIITNQENNKQFIYDIIVVDNNSSDNSVIELKKMNCIKLIESKHNGGFAYGNNIGIKYALDNNADYILLLNNDTIITENCISKLYNKMKEYEDIGIIGSRVMFYDNKNLINYYDGKINWFKGIATIKDKGKTYKENNKQFIYTNFMTGCCMLIKRRVFNDVGLLPEEYFMYYEDVDFCVQVQKAGYKLGVCLDSVIYHKESSSSGGAGSPFAIQWNTRNRLIFIKKYKCCGILTKGFFYITRVFVIIRYIIKGQKEQLKAVIIGIKEGRKIKINEK